MVPPRESMPVRDYRDLRVWKLAMEIVELVYLVCRSLPQDERYVLGPQMRRAAISIPSNIAEGNARRSRIEYLRYLAISAESLAELRTQVELAARLGYLSRESSADLFERTDQVARMLVMMRRGLRKSP